MILYFAELRTNALRLLGQSLFCNSFSLRAKQITKAITRPPKKAEGGIKLFVLPRRKGAKEKAILTLRALNQALSVCHLIICPSVRSHRQRGVSLSITTPVLITA